MVPKTAHQPASRAFWVLLLLALGAFAVSFWVGELSWREVDLSTLWSLRGARALLAFGVGSSLAVAGMLLQALFSNPLCEPYTLGVSSGAACGAVISGALGASASASLFEGAALGPLLGAAVFSLPLVLAKTRGPALLLMGVLLGFFGSSLVALVMAVSDSRGVGQALVWLLGDLSRATTAGAITAVVLSLTLTLLIRRRHSELDILLMGERQARSIGVPVDELSRQVLVVSSILVALGVSFAGMIGFVGLMVPHAVRRWQGAAHWRALPLCWMLGGIVLVVADALGRTVFSPREIPIGVVTALLGVPLYGFWTLKRAQVHA